MNREIEFRAYIKDENIMIDVPIIDFRKSAKCIRTIYGQTAASEWKYKFDDIVLMQYTGLKDKNGKKIFEGDIVKYKTQSGLTITKNVEWVEDNGDIRCGYTPLCDNYYDNGFDGYDFEVIGNIYEDNLESEVN